MMPLPKMTKIIAKPRGNPHNEADDKPDEHFGSRTPVIEDDPDWKGFSRPPGVWISSGERPR